MTDALVRLSKAVRMLSDARDLDDIMRIREMAQVAEAYAKAEKLGDEAEQYASEIRIRAARKAGQVLREMRDAGDMETHGGDRRSSSRASNLKFAEFGVTKDQSSRWQRLALVPDDEFEEHLAEGWGEVAISRGTRKDRHSAERGKGRPKPLSSVSPGPKAKVNGYTRGQSFKGLQSAASQVQALAEALEEGLLGDWTRLYGDPEAEEFFRMLVEFSPVLITQLRKAVRGWKEQVA